MTYHTGKETTAILGTVLCIVSQSVVDIVQEDKNIQKKFHSTILLLMWYFESSWNPHIILVEI